MNAVSLRKEGGIYFVPNLNDSRLNSPKSYSIPPTTAESSLTSCPPVTNTELPKPTSARHPLRFLDGLRPMASDLDRFAKLNQEQLNPNHANRLSNKIVKEKGGMYPPAFDATRQPRQRSEALTSKAKLLSGKAPSPLKTPYQPQPIKQATRTDSGKAKLIPSSIRPSRTTKHRSRRRSPEAHPAPAHIASDASSHSSPN